MPLMFEAAPTLVASAGVVQSASVARVVINIHVRVIVSIFSIKLLSCRGGACQSFCLPDVQPPAVACTKSHYLIGWPGRSLHIRGQDDWESVLLAEGLPTCQHWQPRLIQQVQRTDYCTCYPKQTARGTAWPKAPS